MHVSFTTTQIQCQATLANNKISRDLNFQHQGRLPNKIVSPRASKRKHSQLTQNPWVREIGKNLKSQIIKQTKKNPINQKPPILFEWTMINLDYWLKQLLASLEDKTWAMVCLRIHFGSVIPGVKIYQWQSGKKKASCACSNDLNLVFLAFLSFASVELLWKPQTLPHQLHDLPTLSRTRTNMFQLKILLKMRQTLSCKPCSKIFH